MLGKSDIITRLRELVADTSVTQREIARVLGVPPPRISELFAGKYNLSLEQAKRVVEHYQLVEQETVSAEAIHAILRGMLEERLPNQLTEQDLAELAGALQYLLRRLATHPRLAENPDALSEAARAAVSRRVLHKH